MGEPFVRYRLAPSGREGGLVAEDLLGRAKRAELRIDEPRVSEFHAAVTLRRGGLRLRSLGGALVVEGKTLREVVLHPGMVVHLALGISLEVLELGQLPTDEDAPTDEVAATRHEAAIFPPMRLVCAWSTVRFERPDRETVVIGGNYARILTELAEFAAPVPWEVLARQIWQADEDGDSRTWLRDRYDRTVAKLRRRLLREGLPTDIVRMVDGEVELVVRPIDRVVVS